jgi:hypothetical protein
MIFAASFNDFQLHFRAAALPGDFPLPARSNAKERSCCRPLTLNPPRFRLMSLEAS